MREDFSEIIEDEPDRIDVFAYFRMIKKHMGVILLLMVVCGLGLGFLRPGVQKTMFLGECTVYIPPYSMVEDRKVYNSTYQLYNALRLMQTQSCKDLVAEKMNVESLGEVGSFQLKRIEDTELIEIHTQSSSVELAKDLARAVAQVFVEDVGNQLGVNTIEIVDPARGFSNVVGQSTLHSVKVGCLIGFALGIFYLFVRLLFDKRLKTKEDVESYLSLPVFCVLPDMENKD